MNHQKVNTCRFARTVSKMRGLNSLVSKEGPPWLDPTGKKFFKFQALDWLKTTSNYKIFHSKSQK